VRVLFIGNSFTARNDVPGMIARLADEVGQAVKPQLISVGGASLRTHWNKGDAPKSIKSGRFDYVVLQEQSTLPIKNAARMHENVRLFDEVIKGAGARTVLYMTWARRHAPETQKAITDAYASIGRELGALVAPVGVAWEQFLRKHDAPILHDKDRSHPTAAGSYLAACVIYAVLFGKSPVGRKSIAEGLSVADAKLLQSASWDAVKK
jgi:hypothetical protein